RLGAGRSGVESVGAVAVVDGGDGRRYRYDVCCVDDLAVHQLATRRSSDLDGVGNAAGFHHGAARGAADDGRVVGAVDRDGDDLLGAVDRGDRERVGQMIADVERLNRAAAVIQRVGPGPGGGHLVGAVAVVGGRAGRRYREGVGRVVDVGVGQRAADGR